MARSKTKHGIMNLKARIATLVVAAVAAFSAATMSSRAQEPTAAGLWQKLDEETKKPVIWFLFVDRGGVFEGYAAKLFPEPGETPNPNCIQMHRRPQGRADARTSHDPRHEAGRPQIRGRHRARSARWQGLQRGHDAGPRQAHADAARLSRDSDSWARTTSGTGCPTAASRKSIPRCSPNTRPSVWRPRRARRRSREMQAPRCMHAALTAQASARRPAACRRAGICADRPLRHSPGFRSADAARSSGRSIRSCRRYGRRVPAARP